MSNCYCSRQFTQLNTISFVYKKYSDQAAHVGGDGWRVFLQQRRAAHRSLPR